MSNNLTVGDDFSGRCPCCSERMDVGRITKANLLHPGHVDKCNRCGGEFVVDHIDLIPVVWFRKKENNDANHEADASRYVGIDVGPEIPGSSVTKA